MVSSSVLKKEITLSSAQKTETIQYNIRLNNRSRSLRVTVRPGGELTVSAPRRFVHTIETFLSKKAGWVLDAIDRLKNVPKPLLPKSSRREYLLHKEKARELAKERLEFFNQSYGYTYRRISIKNQKRCWGSCSKKGNLNFNYKIALLSPELADYVIVHELCHLGELNHSSAFWSLVARTMPNYKYLRTQLRKM